MAESKEIYWHLTSKDNQKCRYYHNGYFVGYDEIVRK